MYLINSGEAVISNLNEYHLQSAAAKALYWPFLKQKKVSLGLTLYGEKTFIVKTARELLFEGYQSDLIDMAKDLSSFEDEEVEIPYDKFGWFYQVRVDTSPVRYSELYLMMLNQCILSAK